MVSSASLPLFNSVESVWGVAVSTYLPHTRTACHHVGDSHLPVIFPFLAAWIKPSSERDTRVRTPPFYARNSARKSV